MNKGSKPMVGGTQDGSRDAGLAASLYSHCQCK